MSKLARQLKPAELSEPNHIVDRPSRSSVFLMGAAVAGVVVLIIYASLLLNELRGVRTLLDSRMTQLDFRLGQLASKVELMASRPAPAPTNGPDPNRVYVVNTDGAPMKGPVTAPITIAEFSDFQ